jgi:predicted PurR-regulated permease PerM
MLLGRMSYVFKPLKTISDVLLVPMIISIFIYYALRPLVRWFDKKKINKSLVIILTIVVFLAALITFIGFGGVAVKDQFTGSFSYDMDAVRNYISTIDSKLGGVISQFEFTQKILETLRGAILTIGESVIGIFSQIGNIGTQALLVFFIVFYMLKEDRKFGEWFIKIAPIKYREALKETFSKIDNALSIYISGQLMVAMIIGILMYIGYLIIGMPNALLMAFFSMITSIIPFIGPFLGVIPALLIALTISFGMIIKIAAVAVIVQQVEGNLITPNIMGNKLNIHPLAVILIVILSVNLFGILGAFVGIPMFVVISILIKSIYKFYTMRKFDANN